MNGLPTPAESGPSLELLLNTAFQAAPTSHLASALLSHPWDQPLHGLSRNIIKERKLGFDAEGPG